MAVPPLRQWPLIKANLYDSPLDTRQCGTYCATYCVAIMPTNNEDHKVAIVECWKLITFYSPS